MAFDQRVGGHRFTERGGKCIACGITWAKYDDGGKPRCTGSTLQQPEPMKIPDDDE